MYDYTEASPAPWYAHDQMIKRVIIGNDVTRIGNYAFSKMNAGYYLVGEGVTELGSKSFMVYGYYAAIYFAGNQPEIASDAFAIAKVAIHYIQNWDVAARQKYGATEMSWAGTGLRLVTAPKVCYGLNEPIDMSAVTVEAGPFVYSSKMMEIGEYDNSTYGLKTLKIKIGKQVLYHDYIVADEETYLDEIKVETSTMISYRIPFGKKPEVVVTWRDVVLEENVHYTVHTRNSIDLSTEAVVSVGGKGVFEGYHSEHYYGVMKQDITEGTYAKSGISYYSGELSTFSNVYLQFPGMAHESKDIYQVLMENGTNCGQATAYAVAKTRWAYGMVEVPVTIKLGKTEASLNGAYNGYVEDELNGEVYVSELVIPAGQFICDVITSREHIAYYELYKLEGEEPTLVKSYQSEIGGNGSTEFQYDFSDVYDTDSELHGEIFILNYTWVDDRGDVYAGMLVLGVLGKAPDATTAVLNHVEKDGDFRREYYSLVGEDGNVGNVIWTSSDETVAVVNKGQVTFKQPGTVTITGACGPLSDSITITTELLDMKDAVIFGLDTRTGKAHVAYDYIPLNEGEDYTTTTRKEGGKFVVSVCGKGLFSGQLVREFDETGKPLDHTHSFDNCEDLTCATCTYQRTQAHAYDEKWNKSETEHWHACKLCGQDKDRGEHILSSDNDKLCQTCGQLYMVGDVDDDGEVTDWDGVLLARYLAGWPVDVPIATALDVDGDGEVTDWDGVIMDRYLAGWNVTIG